MKKIFNIIFTILLFIFSFYYTNIVSNFIKNKDPIMIELKNNINNLERDPSNAVIQDNTIIPGLKGKKIDINKSYNKLKKVNKYLESLIVYKEIDPSISLKNHFDKVIISGNKNNKNISILLKINDLELLKKLKDDSLNLILDINFINNNLNYLNNINNNIVVLEQTYLNNSLIDYCYIENIFNSYCSNYQVYTIKPIFITYDYFYNTYKIIENGSIISYNILNEKDYYELYNIISYIKTLGYNIVSLDKLIEE